jgi:peptidyl-prolyl cis-trans isomerase C
LLIVSSERVQAQVPSKYKGQPGAFPVTTAEAGLNEAGSKPVATVNGEVVTLGDLDAVVKLLPAPPAPETEAQRRQCRHEALEMLIDDTLMKQYLHRVGRAVKSKEVDQRLTELHAALKSQHRSFQEFLKDSCQTEAHLRLDVEKKIQWDDLVKQRLTEEKLKAYYEQNREFYDQVTVRASHILVRLPAGAGPAEIEGAQQTLASLRQRVLSGQLDFAAAAKKYSQCTSATKGGDIGYFPRKWAVDERIARTAFSLKVGEVSDVVQSDYGFHLIKVTDRKVGPASDFAKIREEVRENFASDLWQSLLAEQRKIAQIQIHVP